MFKKQSELVACLPKLEQLLQKHGRSNTSLGKAESQFVVRVPLVGAFSSGKSSLVNALIGGEPLLATSIEPETAVPTELVYGAREALTGHSSGGTLTPLSRSDIRANRLKDLKLSWVEAQLPAESLEPYPHLCLVDMPGWESGSEQHARAIDGYVPRSLAYCVVVSVEAGCLSDSIRDALIVLGACNMDVVVIVSKCDKRPEEEIEAVAAKILSEIEAALGRKPLHIAKVSARRKDIAGFTQALAELEKRSEPLFVQHVVQPIVGELREFSLYLNTLINRDDLGSEEIALKRGKLASDMEEFDHRLAEETRSLSEKLPRVIQSILAHLNSALGAQLESLVSQALAGKNLRSSIEPVVRLAVSQGIQREFEPRMQQYLDAVGQHLPTDWLGTANLSNLSSGIKQSGSGYGEIIGGSVPTVLLLLKSLPFLKANPYVLVAVTVFGKLLGELFSRAGREAQEAERREEMRQEILGQVIPDILRSTENALTPLLGQYLQKAKETISASMQGTRKNMEDALNKLDAELAAGRESFETARREHLADLDIVETAIARLEVA